MLGKDGKEDSYGSNIYPKPNVVAIDLSSSSSKSLSPEDTTSILNLLPSTTFKNPLYFPKSQIQLTLTLLALLSKSKAWHLIKPALYLSQVPAQKKQITRVSITWNKAVRRGNFYC